MNNIPSVSVDPEGNISLRGNGNVRILINGKPSGLVGLSGPRASTTSCWINWKVEVITSPSARLKLLEQLEFLISYSKTKFRGL